MTLDDLGWPWTPTWGFYGFFGDFGLRDTFQKRIKINWDRHEKTACKIFSIDFDNPSLDFLGLRKPAHDSIKERYVKVIILPLLASLLWKRLQIDMDMLPITTNTSNELFSRINIDDFERPWTSKLLGFYWFLRSSAAAHTWRMNLDEIARDRLTVCEQKLL